jgi:DNA polymerase III delta prime subunit
MHFTDSIHNVKGYFALSKYTRMTDSKDGHTALGFVFCANEPFQSYVKKLEKYNSEKQVEIKELWFTKPILTEKSEFAVIKSPLYSSSTSRDERYEKFMKTYFSENRNEIWNAVASVNDTPEKFTAFGQDARANILLHGPPGTGKTSLVNRIAITLNRHIVSLDITQFIHNRDFLYRTIYDGCAINGVWCNANRYIVLLEEFDMTVNYFTKRAEKEKEAPKIQLSSECETPLKAKPREFQLDDLLELLQGAIPAPGRILFATTNHFEKLLTILPSLFRPGRLTPVHCNNISWKSLQELTMFYFAKSLELTEPKKMNLCTAEILRIAMDCKINSDKPFEMFSEKIHEKLSLC